MNLYNFVLFHCKRKYIFICGQLPTHLDNIQKVYSQIVPKENGVPNFTQLSENDLIRQLIRDLLVKDVEFKRMKKNSDFKPKHNNNTQNFNNLVKNLERESDALNDLLQSEQGVHYKDMVQDIKNAYELTESIRRIICHPTSLK
jgi:Zn-dependent oligopeptidase